MDKLQLQKISKWYAASGVEAVKNINLQVAAGELVSILGESGSGKTTLLRLIAGFELPTSGKIILNSRIVFDYHHFIPPEKRGVGMVFQDLALFPHLTVFENIAFGLKKVTRKEKRRVVLSLLEMVGLAGYENRFPHELSGGQQQRVALARALAPKPEILLLDEPFSNLDETLKTQVRRDVRHILKQTATTAIFVTHDTRDALAVSDRMAIIKGGEILQIGTPQQIYTQPQHQYVAGFFGKIKFFAAQKTSDGLKTPLGFFPLSGTNGKIQPVTIALRPDNFQILKNGQMETGIPARIIEILYFGDHLELETEIRGKDGQIYPLNIRTEIHSGCQPGDTIYIKPFENKILILGESGGAD